MGLAPAGLSANNPGDTSGSIDLSFKGNFHLEQILLKCSKYPKK